MIELSQTINAHFIHGERGLLYRVLIAFAPRVGDELRFPGEKYFSVVRLVWVYDEPEAKFARLNVEIKEVA
ncbi:hypothetical protein [Massilia brevitalea]|uniref:hypothetical protein n=1 Tax=Massilia brevitalea TaxID=442526 RepID=UPI002739190F|nr:hypothetical protein [Massilia brevitalea]